MAKLANTFEIGCDPEFILLDENGGVVNVKGKLAKDGPVGWDHSGQVLELRPDRARGTYSLLKRLYALLSDNNMAKFRKHKWRAGAYIEDANGVKYTLGGHIHFDVHKSKWTPEMTGALDGVAKLLEELDILPSKENKARRAIQLPGCPKYGQFGEIRNDWADGHVEYRTFSSWLNNPWVAFLVMTTAKLAICSPEDAIPLAGKTSQVALTNFVEKFRFKDINADRLLHKLERPSWLRTPPDTDMKGEWKCS